MTPIQGDWTIDAIGLPAPVLRKIYFDNARKLLARSLPVPVVKAARISNDFTVDGDLSKPIWNQAKPAYIEYQSQDSQARPEVSTPVRLLWSDHFLYLSYHCPFTQLTVFDPPNFAKSAWDFGTGTWSRPSSATTRNSHNAIANLKWRHREKLDLALDLPAKQFDWDSSFERR